MAGLPQGYDFVVIAGATVPDVQFATLVSWISEAATTGLDRGPAWDEPFMDWLASQLARR